MILSDALKEVDYPPGTKYIPCFDSVTFEVDMVIVPSLTIGKPYRFIKNRVVAFEVEELK